jgi:hypothetical protein
MVSTRAAVDATSIGLRCDGVDLGANLPCVRLPCANTEQVGAEADEWVGRRGRHLRLQRGHLELGKSSVGGVARQVVIEIRAVGVLARGVHSTALAKQAVFRIPVASAIYVVPVGTPLGELARVCALVG